MPYHATVYNVMIASPGDVDSEKDVARQIILDWNNLNSRKRSIVLLPIDWRYNSYPAVGARPQAIINEQVLMNADILVGIFWRRLGSPTGTHSSGTVEEIERHVEMQKPTFLYFSDKYVSPREHTNDNQFESVLALERHFRSAGLTHTFQSIDQFANDFKRHLAMALNEPRFDFEKKPVSFGIQETLSMEARELLTTAARSRNGEIIFRDIGNKPIIYSGDRHFLNDRDPRNFAKWKGALDELDDMKFIEFRDKKCFYVTQKGYDLHEQLKES